jgi:hypothetical protein
MPMEITNNPGMDTNEPSTQGQADSGSNYSITEQKRQSVTIKGLYMNKLVVLSHIDSNYANKNKTSVGIPVENFRLV